MFLDIETVPAHQLISQAPVKMQELFIHRFKTEVRNRIESNSKVIDVNKSFESFFLGNGQLKYNDQVVEQLIQQLWVEKAAFHAEFNQVVCIVLGKVVGDTITLKRWCSKHEGLVLEKFAETVAGASRYFVAHNGLEFDFPVLHRKLLMHSMPIPPSLIMIGKKPWEMKLKDTMDMWAGSAYKYKISLDLLCYSLGVESPKAEMSGADVAPLFFSMLDVADGEMPWEKETRVLEQIAEYCCNDVVATVKCYARIMGLPIPTKVEIKAQ